MDKRDKKEKSGGIHSNEYNSSYPINLDNCFKIQNPKKSEVRIDPYGIKEKYLAWKAKTDSHIPGIRK